MQGNSDSDIANTKTTSITAYIDIMGQQVVIDIKPNERASFTFICTECHSIMTSIACFDHGHFP